MKKSIVYILGAILFVSCHSGNQAKQDTTETAKALTEEPQAEGSYTNLLSSIVKIQGSDRGRILENGQGFFVEEDVVVTRLSVLNDANEASISPLNETGNYKIAGYLAIDRINDLVLLKTESISRTPISLASEIAPVGTKSIYLTKMTNNTVPLHTGKILSFSSIKGNKLYSVTNKFVSGSFGTPMFISEKLAIGLCFSEIVDYETQYFVVPSIYISELLKKKSAQPIPLENLNNEVKSISQTNSTIKGLVIETDMGDIQIRLFNETPAYRDNFIKLVRENYFDSLLIHRVIKGFCIQSGAADTRYATKDDVVGWKGPGYTLPAHVVPKFFHKRGMIGSPRKPDTKNAKRRSDGSQFYIVTGRIYGDKTLDEIEKTNNIKFTPEQRMIYKTVGGAPHIDGTYTIFGEVVKGMDIADLIVNMEIGSEFRPLEDIRVKRIRILN